MNRATIPSPFSFTIALLLAALLCAVGAQGAAAASLTTTYADNNGADGVTFDLEVTRPGGVMIRGFDTVSTTGGKTEIEVWTRSGSAIGFTETADGWSLVGSVTTTPEDSPKGLLVRVPTPIYLEEGLHGFAFVYSNETNYTNDESEGRFTKQGDGFTFIAGDGLGADGSFPPAEDFFPGRIWNGTIHYGPDPLEITGPMGTDDARPSFAYTTVGADEIGPLGYECRIVAVGEAPPPFAPCPAPLGAYTAPVPLRGGSYAFEVKTVEADPRAELSASRAFTVATPTQPAPDCAAPRKARKDATVGLKRAQRRLGSARKGLCSARRAGKPLKGAQRRVAAQKRGVTKARTKLKRARAAMPAGC